MDVIAKDIDVAAWYIGMRMRVDVIARASVSVRAKEVLEKRARN